MLEVPILQCHALYHLHSMTLSPPPDLIPKMETKPPPIRVPNLPDLPFDIALQVFTDVSLRPPDDNGSRRADNEVLSVLGQSACSTILTSILCSRTPALSAGQIIVRLFLRTRALSLITAVDCA
jgi:dsRNA-specific ribonuclease